MIIEWYVLTGIIFGTLTIANLLMLFLVKRIITKKANNLISIAKLYFEPSNNGSPSEFSNLVQAVSQSVGSHLASSLKATFMGMASGEAKREKALEGAIAQDALAETNPFLGALANTPAVGKLIKKNPELLMSLAGMLSKKGGIFPGKVDVPGGNSSNKSISTIT